MKVKNYRIKGNFKMGDKIQPFVLECRALSREEVFEKLYSKLGSNHRAKRNMVEVLAIEEITPEEAESLEVLHFTGQR